MFTLKQIALEVQGAIVGDSSTIITSVDDIEEANMGSISFAFLPKYKKIVKSSNASAFIVTNKEDLKDCSGIVVENPYLAMIKILELFSKKIPIKNKLDTNTSISTSASLGENVGISAFSVIGDNAKIGDNVNIGAGVKINEGAIIGANAVIKDNVVIYDDVEVGKNELIHSRTVTVSYTHLTLPTKRIV